MARNIVNERTASLSFDATPSHDLDSFEDDLDAILSSLADIGIEEVLAIDLTKPSLGIPVVRAVIPGLEAALEGPHADYVPGQWAIQLLEETP